MLLIVLAYARIWMAKHFWRQYEYDKYIIFDIFRIFSQASVYLYQFILFLDVEDWITGL